MTLTESSLVCNARPTTVARAAKSRPRKVGRIGQGFLESRRPYQEPRVIFTIPLRITGSVQDKDSKLVIN